MVGPGDTLAHRPIAAPGGPTSRPSRPAGRPTGDGPPSAPTPPTQTGQSETRHARPAEGSDGRSRLDSPHMCQPDKGQEDSRPGGGYTGRPAGDVQPHEPDVDPILMSTRKRSPCRGPGEDYGLLPATED